MSVILQKLEQLKGRGAIKVSGELKIKVAALATDGDAEVGSHGAVPFARQGEAMSIKIKSIVRLLEA
jgi:hypothetical protein